ncbi:hypothetical protein Ancab_022091 [Ancistrocladus abbreviatus]
MKKLQLMGAKFYSCGTPLRCLEKLMFKRMEEWEEWIVEGVYFPCIKRPQLSKCPRLRGCLPAHLPSLEQLHIQNCQQLEGPLLQLESISQLNLVGCDNVELREIFQLTMLAQLVLDNLPQLINMLLFGLAELPSLKGLTISNCSNFISFKDPRLPKGLEYLEIYNCPAVNYNDGLPSSIRRFDVMKVKKMELPKLISAERMQLYSSFWILSVSDDVGSVSFPLGVLPNLHMLEFLRCENLENIYIPDGRGITAQNGLKSLISDCPKLEHVAREGLPVPSLRELSFSRCEKLKSLPSGMCTNLTLC